MEGVVAGYSKKHWYLGTPELKQNRVQRPKDYFIKKIKPRQRKKVQTIKTFINKTI